MATKKEIRRFKLKMRIRKKISGTSNRPRLTVFRSNKEIYAQGTDEDDEVFGYQEAWAEYRYKPSRISGQILDFADFKAYTIADMYEDCPYLSQQWVEEDNTQLRYAMGLSADNPINDFIIDVAVLDSATRPMTLNSIPGLMDHM